METITKVIPAENGKLYALADGNRYFLADCRARIEIVEYSDALAVLGRGRVIKRRDSVLLVTFNQQPHLPLALDALSGFGFQGDLLRRDGRYERLTFDRCLLDGDLDLTECGECSFFVECSHSMICRLKNF